MCQSNIDFVQDIRRKRKLHAVPLICFEHLFVHHSLLSIALNSPVSFLVGQGNRDPWRAAMERSGKPYGKTATTARSWVIERYCPGHSRHRQRSMSCNTGVAIFFLLFFMAIAVKLHCI